MLQNPKSIEDVRSEMANYIKEGRSSAFGGGTKLPLDTEDAKAKLTGNYENICYEKNGEDKVLTLAEFKCGKIVDTTAVSHTDSRLVKGTNITVSVKNLAGQYRNRITFV